MEDDEQHGCGRQHNDEHSEPGVLGKVLICGLVQDLLDSRMSVVSMFRRGTKSLGSVSPSTFKIMLCWKGKGSRTRVDNELYKRRLFLLQVSSGSFLSSLVGIKFLF